jgi:predicted RNA-binding Zn-ribbon protein involved in translation (DUF1610 family)
MAGMPSDFITLSCPTCGAKLEVTDDIERFACRYCGNEHMVRRSGGIVSLKAVTEGLKHVQVGVDKTAAELAIRRLKEEMSELQATMDAVTADARARVARLQAGAAASRPGGWFATAAAISVIVLLRGCSELASQGSGGLGPSGFGLLGVGACAIWLRGISRTRRDLARQAEEVLALAEEQRSGLEERMAKLRKKLKKNREFVD